MRIPTMTVEQAESELGPRGHLLVNDDNRRVVRKWLVAQGYPAAFAAERTVRELSNAYNETDGTGLAVVNRLLKAWKEKNASPVPQAPFSLEQATRDVAAVRRDMESSVAAVEQVLGAMGEPVDESSPDCGIFDQSSEGQAARAALPQFGHATREQAPESNIPFVTPLPSAPVDKAKALFEILQSIGTLDAGAVEAIVEARLSKFRDLLPDFVAACSPVTRIEILRPDATIHRVEGIIHPQFELLLKLATSRDSHNRVPGIFIAGEASSGKTTGCEMLAAALGLPWHCNGAISQPHEMLGFIDGAGKYHRTPFREAYEHGGVYTFDEVDRSDAVALLGVNPHLAGNTAAFPDGMIKRHPNFILTGTANTWGLGGGNADYAGATKLDAAFLSRFPSKLAWDIDLQTEIHISGNESWALRVQAARKRARDAGLKVMICARQTIAGAAHIANGMTPDQAAACTYLANLKPADRATVEGY